jgi:hypothetical protein
VENVDGQVVPLLAHQILRLLLANDSRPVVGVDDVVADLKLADRRLELEVGDSRLFQYLLCCYLWNWSLLSS